MNGKNSQDFLFQRIKEVLPRSRSLADTIAEVLCISQDSAYRRIRGETPLLLEEARILCQQFNLSLDQLLALTDESVIFKNTRFNTTVLDFTSFLNGVLQEVNHLALFEEKNIVYACKDIPLFQQLYSREVLAFRYFFWMRNVFQHPDFVQRKFSLHCLTPEAEALSNTLYTAYCRIPSAEIWSLESINGFLLQLQYYVKTGLVSRDDMQEICAGLHRMLEHLQLQAAYGCKFRPGENPRSKKENFQLYYNRMGVTNNTILTSCDGKQKVYLNYEALSYVETTDETFCNEVHAQLQADMRRATLISSVSEKQRHIFFNHLYAKLPTYGIGNAKLAS